LTKKTRFLASLRKYVPIMVKSFFLIIFIITRVFFMKLHMLQLLNKTGLLRGSINIFLMCVCSSFPVKILNIFWSYSLKLVVYLINRLPIPFLSNQSLYELVYSTKPKFSNLIFFAVWLTPVLPLLEELN